MFDVASERPALALQDLPEPFCARLALLGIRYDIFSLSYSNLMRPAELEPSRMLLVDFAAWLRRKYGMPEHGEGGPGLPDHDRSGAGLRKDDGGGGGGGGGTHVAPKGELVMTLVVRTEKLNAQGERALTGLNS